MSPPPTAADLPFSEEPLDPDLAELPRPRRPARGVTLAVLALTALAAALLLFALRADVRYALRGGPPRDLGELVHAEAGFSPGEWVRGAGLLAGTGAIRYGRVLERDTFRLAPLAGSDRLWVEVRVPEGMESPRFVPPTSFVGRLERFRDAGLRHAGLAAEVSRATGARVPADAWLLVDGEGPGDLRWALALVAVLAGFAAFALWGLYRLVRPVHDE